MASSGLFFALFIFIYGIINFISEALFSNSHTYNITLCSSRKYPYSPHERCFVLHPPPPGSSRIALYFASKILTFKTSLPLGISLHDLPWGWYGFYLELHIKKRMVELNITFTQSYKIIQIFISSHLCPGNILYR